MLVPPPSSAGAARTATLGADAGKTGRPTEEPSMTTLTLRNKIGLVIAAVLGLGDLLSLLGPTPDGQEGPPFAVLVLGTLLGLVTLAAIVPAWRTGSRVALRVVAGTRILSALTSIPAFFVDIPAGLRAAAAVGFALTVVCVVLVLAPAQRRALVTD
jgi:hypothetical protein